MKKIKLLAMVSFLGVSAAALSGCATVAQGVGTGPASIFSNTKGPLLATSVTGKGNKRGEACSSNILGIVATGDASIATAAAMGDINDVKSVDYSATNILYVYARFCTIVTGN